jgi:hypothetical protein
MLPLYSSSTVNRLISSVLQESRLHPHPPPLRSLRDWLRLHIDHLRTVHPALFRWNGWRLATVERWRITFGHVDALPEVLCLPRFRRRRIRRSCDWTSARGLSGPILPL